MLYNKVLRTFDCDTRTNLHHGVWKFTLKFWHFDINGQEGLVMSGAVKIRAVWPIGMILWKFTAPLKVDFSHFIKIWLIVTNEHPNIRT